MPQVIGTLGTGVTGHMIGLGLNPNSQVLELMGPGDPNSGTDPAIASAEVSSIYHRVDAPDATHAIYVKTVFVAGANGTWTPK